MITLRKVVDSLDIAKFGSIALTVAIATHGCAARDEDDADVQSAASMDATADAISTGEPLACERDYFGCPLEQSFRANSFDSCLAVQEVVNLSSEVFDALTGNSPIAFEIEMGSAAAESHCAWFDDVIVIGDGSAIMRRTFQTGAPTFSRRVEIKPPSFLEECKALTDPTEITNCMREWFVPDTCIAPLCCPGGDHYPCE